MADGLLVREQARWAERVCEPKANSGIQFLHRVLARPGWQYTFHIIGTFKRKQLHWMPFVETVFMLLFKAKCEVPTRITPFNVQRMLAGMEPSTFYITNSMNYVLRSDGLRDTFLPEDIVRSSKAVPLRETQTRR